MLDKGLVLRDVTERAHVYRAAIPKIATEQRFLRDLSNRLFAGSAGQLALRALEMEQASEEELSEIRKLIAKRRS
jgi:BlaI family penicillinase repressor